jgi:solute carrier family 25 protein 16
MGSTRSPSHHQRSPEYILKTLVAGGVAGSAAKTLIAPLDRVKILFQTNNAQFIRYSGSLYGVVRATRVIWKEHGIQGLFQGHAATLLRIFPYAAIKFLAYEQYRALLMPTKADRNPWRQFWAGSFAGMTSVIFTYPMELIRVRMAYETEKISILKTCQKIIQQSHREYHGHPLLRIPNVVGHFYRGLSMTLAGMIPYAGMSFCAHSVLVDLFRVYVPYATESSSNVDAHLRVWAELVCGGLSGAFAQTVSYPLEIIRRRMQVAGMDVKHPSASISFVIKDIWKSRGFRGFYVGLSIGYIKVTPMVAVSFTVYGRMKRWLDI